MGQIMSKLMQNPSKSTEASQFLQSEPKVPTHSPTLRISAEPSALITHWECIFTSKVQRRLGTWPMMVTAKTAIAEMKMTGFFFFKMRNHFFDLIVNLLKASNETVDLKLCMNFFQTLLTLPRDTLPAWLHPLLRLSKPRVRAEPFQPAVSPDPALPVIPIDLHGILVAQRHHWTAKFWGQGQACRFGSCLGCIRGGKSWPTNKPAMAR